MKKFGLMCLLFVWSAGWSQTHKLIVGGTPNLMAKPRVVNPSPAKVYGPNTVSVEAELLYNYISKSHAGFLIGFNAGIVHWNTILKAPRIAFGTHKNPGNVYFNRYSDDYYYTGLVAGLTHEGSIKRLKYNIELGTSLRWYPIETEEDVVGAAFSRETPYNPEDPNAGPPDLLVEIPPAAEKLHPDIFLSMIFPVRLSKKSEFMFGITSNLNVIPIGRGDLLVQYNDVIYRGEFSPRSSYVGVKVRYSVKLLKGEPAKSM
jgi:hypothetical protein